ncbi:MAG: hypothetical protein L0J13_14660, partial [Brevibacterium sp.]|nr:hypothetical protein [Brevibacterium sp.]
MGEANAVDVTPRKASLLVPSRRTLRAGWEQVPSRTLNLTMMTHREDPQAPRRSTDPMDESTD